MVEQGTQPATLLFLSEASRIRRSRTLRQREHPHRAPFGHSGYYPGNAVEPGVHPARIAAPAGVHGDVLLAVDGERRRRRDDARAGRNSHSSLPLAASNAWIRRSAVPPVNTSPPAVASIEPQFGLFG